MKDPMVLVMIMFRQVQVVDKLDNIRAEYGLADRIPVPKHLLREVDMNLYEIHLKLIQITH